MKKTKPPFQLFENAVEKFLTDNLEQTPEYNCEAQLYIVNKLLISRTADEILVAENFVNTLLIEQTDVVDALNKALIDSQMAGHRGFQNGNEYEYFAILISLLAKKIQHWAKELAEGESCNDNIHPLITWAEVQTDESIETALVDYIDVMFPGRQRDALGLVNLAGKMFVRIFMGDHHNTKGAKTFFKEVLTAPDLNDVVKVGIGELIQYTKSEAAAKAGKQGHKASIPLKEFAIAEYKAGKWNSPHDASKRIYPMIVKKFRNNTLSEDNGETTVYRWLLAYDKQNRKQK